MSTIRYKPNPGSDEAIAAGCTCPVLDNGHGRGIAFGLGVSFWVNELCPLHGYAALTSNQPAATVPSRDDSCD